MPPDAHVPPPPVLTKGFPVWQRISVCLPHGVSSPKLAWASPCRRAERLSPLCPRAAHGLVRLSNMLGKAKVSHPAYLRFGSRQVPVGFWGWSRGMLPAAAGTRILPCRGVCSLGSAIERILRGAPGKTSVNPDSPNHQSHPAAPNICR